MKRTLLTIISVLLSIAAVYAQKEKTLVGDAWIGTVEYADEATREIKLVNPNKKTETFVGFLIAPYIVKLKDGALREVQFSEIKPGMRVRAFYKSKTEDMAGKRRKFNLIDDVQFLGHDDYTRLRAILKLDPSIPVTTVADSRLTSNDSLKLYLAIQPRDLSESMIKWADQWNQKQSAKHWRVRIVDDPAQSDASLVVIWGEDDSYIKPEIQMHRPGDMVSAGPSTASAPVTIYMTTKDENGLKVLWERHRMMAVFNSRVDVPIVVRDIENKLKALYK